MAINKKGGDPVEAPETANAMSDAFAQAAQQAAQGRPIPPPVQTTPHPAQPQPIPQAQPGHPYNPNVQGPYMNSQQPPQGPYNPQTGQPLPPPPPGQQGYAAPGQPYPPGYGQTAQPGHPYNVPPQTQTPPPPPPHQARRGAPNTPPNNPPPANGAQPVQNRRGIMNVNSLFSRPISRLATGEVVVKYKTTLEKQMELNFRQGFDSAFKLFVLDNNNANVGPLSSILVTYHEVQAGQHYMAVYTLLVEASSAGLNPKTVHYSGRNIEIETVSGDVFNDILWNRIVEHITTVTGQKLNVLEAGTIVLPRELDPEDEDHLRRVIFEATQACYTVMETELGGKQDPFTIALINTGAENLVARLDYNPGSAETSTGLPVRSDVRISLQGSVNDQQAAGGFEQIRELVVVDAFIDLTYSPPGPPVPGQLPTTQYYYPRAVITRADTVIDAITMELQLLALSQATLLNRNMAWAGVFRPRHHIKGLDTRDIGAVNWEINLADNPGGKPDKIDTKAKSFGDTELYQLVTMSIHDKLLYSMDIEEVGELSWIHQAYLASADGDPKSYQLVIEAANKLTMGHFSQVFQGGAICYNEANRIHLGYYLDESGVKRDLREIDYLALLNVYGKDDPKAIVKWGETFDNRDIPIEIRMEDRANILKGILGANIHIKGYARRITFDPNFMIALNIACSRAGLIVRPNNLIQEFTGQGVRGNLNAGLYGVAGNQVTGIWNQGPSPYGNAGRGGINPHYMGRFGRGGQY